MMNRIFNSGFFTSGSCAILLLILESTAAAAQEEQIATVTELMAYVFFAFVIAVIVAVYFMKSLDRRETPIARLFGPEDTVHAVGPNHAVADCVRRMNVERIGALVVVDNGRLLGIFTERDALNRVLADGLDPKTTHVSQVMTREPCSVTSSTTVAEAMELITRRRFRHLPVVDEGRLVAMVSSGDLTRWLIRERVDEVQEFFGAVARP